MRTLAEIQQILRNYQPELKSKYGIERLALFGPYAHQEQTKEGDIDILVSWWNTLRYSTLLPHHH
ncbi:putative nucleotidyltransferase [Beggiatoa alba B18LD]|uniref:Putative nucleotidyltransferase n=1 Tax=Beggiatoa alba B18LD TaxID=395493 RepID=I3CKJ1_9GAMM|nr:nucleotidyltransferase domain-containing protein [Beggiatoa alba]EIJ44134.1 putative nucleotidyltransferase [Beggiatoa alba B18LD]